MRLNAWEIVHKAVLRRRRLDEARISEPPCPMTTLLFAQVLIARAPRSVLRRAKRFYAFAALTPPLLILTACATAPADDLTACPAYAPAYAVTDAFMTAFNAKDAEAWGATFHFPSVRLASSATTVINSAADLESSFARLEATGWHHSAWAMREVVQCEPAKAHMLTTFVRYRADGSELSRFDSLYIIEQRAGRWAVAARSSFAP